MDEWREHGLWKISPGERWRIMSIECHFGERHTLYDWHPLDHGLPKLVAVRDSAEAAKKLLEEKL